ncbi:hypothetical protein ANCDUO_06873, partial [Ancylostoma duodenale]
RLAEIGSRLTDVNASLEEAHRGVAELDEHHHRRPSVSLATDVTPTSSKQRQAGVLGSTPRTDSFEERLRSINQKKKSSFDDFTLNITQERILAAKASAPDPLGVTPFSGISSGSGLSSSGFSRNVTAPRPALSITIPQPGSASQSTATTPASSRLDSPLSSRKTGAPYGSNASTSRPPQSAPSTTASTPPVRLAAPPTAPVIAYPPNFSVPPPNFPVTPSSSAYAPSSTPDSQTSPILSAPPPPPQLTPAMQDTTSSRDASSLKSPTSTSVHCPSLKTSATSSSCGTRTTHANPHTTHSTSIHSSHHPHGASSSLPSSSQTNPHSHSHQGSSHSQATPKGPLSTSKTPSAVQRTSNEKQFPPRHDSMSALKSPVSGTASSSLTGRSLSVSDSRKQATTPVAHKDPSTELLAGLFHNKPPTTDFRKLPKIEKKPSAASSHNEKDHHSHEQSKKHSVTLDQHRKEKDHKPVGYSKQYNSSFDSSSAVQRRKEDGSFETKEERAKRKEAERAKREREKMKDQKREKKKAFSKQFAHLVAEDSGSSCAGASGGLSMYDRVKRRSSAANKDDGTKKTAALQRLRDKNNERKNQKRIRVQLDSSDEEDEGHSSTRKVVDSDVDDSSEEEEEVRVEKTENVDSSEEEETKKKRDWSTDESEESDAGNRKQHKKSIKKTSEKNQKHGKNINMDDVFGADSTDNEKPPAAEERDKKRKKLKKESSDENEAPKKKLRNNPSFTESKPAKRQKKSHRSDESSDSEAEPQSVSRKIDEAEACQPSLKEEKGDQSVVEVKEEVAEEKLDESCRVETDSMEVVKPDPDLEEENKGSMPQTDMTDTEETNAAPAVAVPTSSTQIPAVSDQSRPKLLTKAAMKIFVPSQSAVATSTVPATQPSTEADSDEDSTDYDDVFAVAVPGPSSSQHNVTSSTLPTRRASTSSSAATEPDDASDSDSDSQRSRHRAVELVDAAAGYASVKNADDTISSSDECTGPKEDVPDAVNAPTTPEQTSAEKDETEDAVKSIFDGDDEEEEPQYPTLVFVPGKNGAVVASAGLSTASEVAIASASIAVSNDETNRAASAIAHVDDEDEEDADIAPGDVSDEQLLRESFVEEPILEEKPAADKSLETPTSVEERIPHVEQPASNVIVIEDDDEVVEVPCSESTTKEPQPPRAASYQQPNTPQVSVPISVAIPDRKAPTPLQSPKVAAASEAATFVQPPAVQPVKASPVPSSGYVSVLPSASPVSGGITQGTPVVTQAGLQQLYNRFQQPAFTHANTPAATPSPAPQPVTPVSQHQAALAAQATLQMQLQQMQMLQMASRDPVAYYQQMSQTFGQPMATALLAQLQAMQQLPTSQAQQYLLELQRQQQIKVQQEAATTVSSSPQPAHQQQQQQERERLLKESQLRAMREREALQAQQQAHAQSTQQQQAAALYAAQLDLHRFQASPMISRSPSLSAGPAAVTPQPAVTVQQERKSVAVQPQPRTSETIAHSVIPTTSAAAPSPSGTASTPGHHADVAKLGWLVMWIVYVAFFRSKLGCNFWSASVGSAWHDGDRRSLRVRLRLVVALRSSDVCGRFATAARRSRAFRA